MAIAAVRAQADRHLAMCERRAVWIALAALGVRAENSPEHAAWIWAWDAWAAHASDAERHAEYATSMDAMDQARETAEKAKAARDSGG